MNLYIWFQFALVCIIGAMSPGPSLAVVIRNNHVIAVEDQHGTDSMLNRANSVIKKFYKSKKK